jgi:signal recognition particle receptor subunit beta
MPHINVDSREIVFKLVYYGPGRSGKTTNLIHIHQRLPDRLRSDLITLDTTEDRTLFFDFLPLELGTIEGYSVRFHMYTVPGQIHYEASRRLILEGADGVVFVADSQPERLDDNLGSYELMRGNLRSYGLEPEGFPTVLQYNKRDIAEPLPLGLLEKELALDGIHAVEAVATRGDGVLETIRLLTRQVVERFQL